MPVRGIDGHPAQMKKPDSPKALLYEVELKSGRIIRLMATGTSISDTTGELSIFTTEVAPNLKPDRGPNEDYTVRHTLLCAFAAESWTAFYNVAAFEVAKR